MADTDAQREEDLRRLLTDAIEVQLAALKAGISFWTEWIEQTSDFVQSASKTLSAINTEDPPKDVLLELVDAARASMRAITEIPRHTATRFIDELDKLAKEDATPPSASPRRRAAAAKGAASKSRGRPRRKRANRVKT